MKRLALPAACVLLCGALTAGTALSQEGKPEPKGPLTRVVTVVSAGVPVIGARVEAWRGTNGWSRHTSAPIVKTTGADGVVRFEDMPREDVVYVARKPGFRCGWHQPGRWWWSTPEEDEDPDGDGITKITLGLAPGSVVEGRVVAKKDGAPIAGVIVEAWEIPQATDQWLLDGAPFWTATTDAKGRFRTAAHWPARREGQGGASVVGRIIARGSGWIHELTEVHPQNAGNQEPLEFELLPAAEIRGTVTDASGEPCAGALVYAYPPDHWAFAVDRRERRNTRETHPREMQVRADEHGLYALPEAYPGVRYHLWAEKMIIDDEFDELVLERSPVVRDVGAEAVGGKATCDFRMRRLGKLTVRLAPDAGGEEKTAHMKLHPPRGAKPWAYDHEEEDAVVVAEADAGTWLVEVWADGWADQTFPVILEEGEDKSVELRLSRGAAIEGVVVDDRGTPVPDARLYAYFVDPADPDEHVDGNSDTSSDPSGRFLLRGLPAGAIDIGASHDDLTADGLTRITAPAKHVRIVMNRKAVVRFHLNVPGGVSAPDRVRLTVTRMSGASKGQQTQHDLERSSADGSYTVDMPLPGPVWFGIEAAGFAPLVVRVDVRAGAVNSPEPFVLARGISLHGRVVDGSGNPIAGARILPWGNEEKAVTASSRGAFEVPHLAPGKVDLSITAPGMAEALVQPTAVEGGETQQFVLTPGGLVRGRFSMGSAPSSIDIFPAASPGDYGSRWRVDLKDDTFSVRLPPGKYRVPQRRVGASGGPAVFDVDEGGETVLDLEAR